MRFRIFDKRENRHYFDAEYLLTCQGVLFYEDVMDGRIYRKDPENTVVQFSTGLTDAEGREIFEGDWVNWEETSGSTSGGIVGFSPSSAAFIIDVSGRHLIGDTKYGDFCYMHKNQTYKIIKK